jgi:hypothetical protein
MGWLENIRAKVAMPQPASPGKILGGTAGQARPMTPSIAPLLQTVQPQKSSGFRGVLGKLRGFGR